MSEPKILSLKAHGKKKVKIVDDGYGLSLLTMRNGYQWSGGGVDKELLEMIHEATGDTLKMLREQSG